MEMECPLCVELIEPGHAKVSFNCCEALSHFYCLANSEWRSYLRYRKDIPPGYPDPCPEHIVGTQVIEARASHRQTLIAQRDASRTRSVEYSALRAVLMAANLFDEEDPGAPDDACDENDLKVKNGRLASASYEELWRVQNIAQTITADDLMRTGVTLPQMANYGLPFWVIYEWFGVRDVELLVSKSMNFQPTLLHKFAADADLLLSAGMDARQLRRLYKVQAKSLAESRLNLSAESLLILGFDATELVIAGLKKDMLRHFSFNEETWASTLYLRPQHLILMNVGPQDFHGVGVLRNFSAQRLAKALGIYDKPQTMVACGLV